MSRREPWAVRLYRRAAWTVGDLSTDATDAFAALYADERRRGFRAATRLWLRAMIDLVRAGAIVTRPRPFAALGHDLRWAWRTLRTRPGAEGRRVGTDRQADRRDDDDADAPRRRSRSSSSASRSPSGTGPDRIRLDGA